MNITLFYTPFPSKEVAAEVIKTLLAENLIACGNVVTSDSMYMWLGQLTTENEFIAIMKTLPEKTESLTQRIASLHPYEVPAILHWQVEANEPYYNWIKTELGL
jgi:periplasmic divalent cation tolerance protein